MTAAELKVMLENELNQLTQLHDGASKEAAVLEAKLKHAGLNAAFFMGRMSQLQQTISQVGMIQPQPQQE
jgi:hypothetical protein